MKSLLMSSICLIIWNDYVWEVTISIIWNDYVWEVIS